MHIRRYLFLMILFAAMPVCAQETKPSIFLDAGIPATSREWTGKDYARAKEILASGVTPLPYLSDKDGARLFERMTALENFSFHRNRTVPLQMRLEDYFHLLNNANSIMKMYFFKSPGGRKEHAELARLLGFMVQAVAEGVVLADEFLPTVAKDEKYETRMAGMRQMRSGLTTVLVGAELSLTEDNGFTSEDRSILLNAMAAALPKLKASLTPDYIVELRKKLQAHRVKFTGAADRASIDSMVRELGG
jgi:hypothetical protein